MAKASSKVEIEVTLTLNKSEIEFIWQSLNSRLPTIVGNEIMKVIASCEGIDVNKIPALPGLAPKVMPLDTIFKRNESSIGGPNMYGS